MKISKIYRNVAIALMLAVASFEAFASGTDDNGMVIDGVKYTLSQNRDLPLWLTISQCEKSVRILNIPDTIDYPVYEGFTQKAIVEKIGDDAFGGSDLVEVRLPKSVRRIGNNAFSGSSLSKIDLPQGLVYIGSNAFSGTNINSIKIPESVIYLDYCCFGGCYELECVELPSTLVSLGRYTFQDSGFIKKIVCHATNPPIADETDFGMGRSDALFPIPDVMPGPNPDDCKIYVPRESIELYRNAPGWDMFNNFLAIEDMTDDVEMPTAEAQGIEYTVDRGTVTVSCQSGDVVQIFDASGVCIDRKAFESAGRYTYSGSGVCIVHLNGRSVKVIL